MAVAQGIARREAVLRCIDGETRLSFLSDFDAAIVGLVEQYGLPQPVVLYDKNKILEILQGHGLNPLQAIDYFDQNIGCLWLGEETPAFAILT